VSTVTNDVDDIRRKMATIRRELHEDVRGVVATAEAATDWKRYLTAYPWASLGVAFALGFWIVPKRRRSPVSLAGMATQEDLSKVREAVETTRETVVKSVDKVAAGAEKHKKGLLGAGFALVTPLIWKAVQGYGMKFLEQWIMQQQMHAMHAGPQPDAPGGAPGQPPSGPFPGFSPGPQAGNMPRPGGPRRAGGPGAV